MMVKQYVQKTLENIKKVPLKWWIVLAVVWACCAIFFRLWLIFDGPSDFPVGTTITIQNGASISGTAAMLQQDHVIVSPLVFRYYLRGKTILAGDYLLDEHESVFRIADRLVAGDFRVPSAKILITEGENIFDIAAEISANIPSFEKKAFIELAAAQEGYLFPDTYFFMHTVTPEDVVKTMSDNFKLKTISLAEKISKSGHSESEIVTMASIIEREAVTPKDRRMVSGILWRRISIGMRLQADATFGYINGKGSASLTMADLKIDSPYNTYVYKGLPPGPISNPGLDAIIAAIEPTKSSYLYYLSDKNGVMHYAKTFDEHIANKSKYLK